MQELMHTGDWHSCPCARCAAHRDANGHLVDIELPPGQYEGNEDRFELFCECCDYLGAADTIEEARAIARLHEGLVATLVEKWRVER